MYGRMTDIAEAEGEGLDQKGGSPKGPCQARGAPVQVGAVLSLALNGLNARGDSLWSSK